MKLKIYKMKIMRLEKCKNYNKKIIKCIINKQFLVNLRTANVESLEYVKFYNKEW